MLSAPAMPTDALASEFLRTAIARGQFHQCTDLEGLDAVAANGVTGYIGFDMTAPSLHIGNLTQITDAERESIAIWFAQGARLAD